MTRIPAECFTLLTGEEYLSMYQFNSKVTKHYFCKVCGIYTFHRARTAPDPYGINVGCLDGVSLEVSLIDGQAYSVARTASRCRRRSPASPAAASVAPDSGWRFDANDKVWVTSFQAQTISVFDNTGKPLSPPEG